ncbi:MAG: glycosyltransferase family 2 protein [Cyclobacteriaceae bacterium]
MSYSVAIVILNWNGWEYTRACLESLLNSGFPPSQVIIVDNHSEDGSFDYIKETFPDIQLIRNHANLGFAGGNNVGIRKALEEGYRYIMLLNNDTELNPDFLTYLVEEMEISENVAAIQPLIYFLRKKDKLWNAGGRFRPWLAYSQTCYKIKNNKIAYPTDWITGCAILVRAKVIKEVGLLDEQYFAYFEDVDWSLRMKKRGYALKVHPLSVIFHEAGASSKSKNEEKEGFLDPKVHYLNARNQVFQLRKHARFPLGIVAWPAQLIRFGIFACYFLVRGRKNKLKAVIRGWKEGFTTKISNQE